jgi:hypothetical protein
MSEQIAVKAPGVKYKENNFAVLELLHVVRQSSRHGEAIEFSRSFYTKGPKNN